MPRRFSGTVDREWWLLLGSVCAVFARLSAWFSSFYPVGFTGFCALVKRCWALPYVMCSLLPSVYADVEGLQRYF